MLSQPTMGHPHMGHPFGRRLWVIPTWVIPFRHHPSQPQVVPSRCRRRSCPQGLALRVITCQRKRASRVIAPCSWHLLLCESKNHGHVCVRACVKNHFRAGEFTRRHPHGEAEGARCAHTNSTLEGWRRVKGRQRRPGGGQHCQRQMRAPVAWRPA